MKRTHSAQRSSMKIVLQQTLKEWNYGRNLIKDTMSPGRSWPPSSVFWYFLWFFMKFRTRQDNRHVFTSSAWSNDCKSTVKKEIKRKVWQKTYVLLPAPFLYNKHLMALCLAKVGNISAEWTAAQWQTYYCQMDFLIIPRDGFSFQVLANPLTTMVS